MKYLEEIKEMLCEELEKIGKKGELTAGSLETVHKLTDTIKNIGKIEMLEEEGGYSEEGNYGGGSSYARGGRGRGRNAKRDSMGRYSREGEGYSEEGYSEEGYMYARDGRGGQGGMRGGYSRDGAKEHLMNKAEEMLEMAHDPKERRAIEKFMRELEND